MVPPMPLFSGYKSLLGLAFKDGPFYCILIENLDPVKGVVFFLGRGLFYNAAKGHLGHQLVGVGDLEEFFNVPVNEGVVVLDIGAYAKFGQGGPNIDLEHAAGLLGPVVHVMGIDGVVFFHLVYNVLVDEVEDGAGSGLEAVDFIAGDLAVKRGIDLVPNLVMALAKG